MALGPGMNSGMNLILNLAAETLETSELTQSRYWAHCCLAATYGKTGLQFLDPPFENPVSRRHVNLSCHCGGKYFPVRELYYAELKQSYTYAKAERLKKYVSGYPVYNSSNSSVPYVFNLDDNDVCNEVLPPNVNASVNAFRITKSSLSDKDLERYVYQSSSRGWPFPFPVFDELVKILRALEYTLVPSLLPLSKNLGYMFLDDVNLKFVPAKEATKGAYGKIEHFVFAIGQQENSFVVKRPRLLQNDDSPLSNELFSHFEKEHLDSLVCEAAMQWFISSFLYISVPRLVAMLVGREIENILSRVALPVMEKLDAKTLEEYLIMEDLSKDERCSIFEQVCDSILKLHHLGLCHNDLTLENILYDRSTKNAYIIDFGFTRIFRPACPKVEIPSVLQNLLNFNGSGATPSKDLNDILWVADALFSTFHDPPESYVQLIERCKGTSLVNGKKSEKPTLHNKLLPQSMDEICGYFGIKIYFVLFATCDMRAFVKVPSDDDKMKLISQIQKGVSLGFPAKEYNKQALVAEYARLEGKTWSEFKITMPSSIRDFDEDSLKRSPEFLRAFKRLQIVIANSAIVTGSFFTMQGVKEMYPEVDLFLNAPFVLYFPSSLPVSFQCVEVRPSTFVLLPQFSEHSSLSFS